jgi:hypothetical protein
MSFMPWHANSTNIGQGTRCSCTYKISLHFALSQANENNDIPKPNDDDDKSFMLGGDDCDETGECGIDWSMMPHDDDNDDICEEPEQPQEAFWTTIL